MSSKCSIPSYDMSSSPHSRPSTVHTLCASETFRPSSLSFALEISSSFLAPAATLHISTTRIYLHCVNSQCFCILGSNSMNPSKQNLRPLLLRQRRQGARFSRLYEVHNKSPNNCSLPINPPPQVHTPVREDSPLAQLPFLALSTRLRSSLSCQ